MKKLVLMAAVAGLSLTLLFAQNPDVNSQRDALDVLREKRMQLNNPQAVTQSKIFLLQQKEFETKAETAKARAEEARNRAKAAKGKSAEPPTASEKANRPAYDQRRLELAAEQAEAEAEAAQLEAEAVQAQVDALKAKVEAARAKADEVRTSPYRRAQSKYYDAQWQEQLEKKTLQEQAQVSVEAVQKTRAASDALRRAKVARDTARKNAIALAAKKSGVPAVSQDTTAMDQEMARRAHELEVAQAKAEKDAADARERAKKSQVVAAPKPAPIKPETQIPALKSTDASSKSSQLDNAAQKQAEQAMRAQQAEEARKAQAEAAAAKKQQADEARKAQQEAAAAKKQQEEAARKAKELEKQQAREAKAQKKGKEPVVSLRSAPVAAGEAESDIQAKALEALRKKQADLDVLEGKPTASTVAAPVKQTASTKEAAPVKTKASASRAEKTSSESTGNSQEKALEALRKKQAELDVQDTQSTVKSGTTQAKAEATRKPKASKVAKGSKAEELELASQGKKSQEPAVERATATKVQIDTTAVDAETKKLQDLRQRQADLRAQQIKVKTDLQDAARNASEKKGKSDEGVELIVDNPASRPTGTWMNGKTRGYYGGDYIWKGKGTGANYVKFVPVIPAAGEYEVFEWHVAGTNRASDAPYIISYNGGTQTILVNQQLNGSKWNSLGKFNFSQGSSGEVRITDGISTAGQMVMADAIRFAAANGGGETTATVADSNSAQVEALRKQQADLDAELAKLKEQISASESRIASLNQSGEKAQIEAAELEALRNAKAKPSTASKVAVKAETKKTAAASKSTAKALPVEATADLSPRDKKLAELLQRYKSDEITPHEYHQMRAKIIAEP